MTTLSSKLRGALFAASAAVAAVLAFGVVRVVTDPAGATAEPAALARPQAVGELPIILLSGYEPFGPGRPPNPSWEGVKGLDGKEWNGYRIVARQAKCVWGQPMVQMKGWLTEHKPVAVFSFGQGMPGGFALESKAFNTRGRIPDNDGNLPPDPSIVAGGPDHLDGTLQFNRYARALSAKGHPVRVSTSAGRYLCEEMLYTLEHLKSQKQLEGTVAFCHVPPLGTKVEGQPVTAESVRRFVEDLLAVWHATDAPAPAAAKDAADPRHADVKAMVERYFRVWSEQDMRGYDDCFLPDASVQFIDANGDMTSTPRAQFVESQRRYHLTSPVKTVEVPTAIDVRSEGPLARAVAAWKLTAGPRTETGYDHFTLMNQNGRWRIVNLVFYATPAGWDRAAAKP